MKRLFYVSPICLTILLVLALPLVVACSQPSPAPAPGPAPTTAAPKPTPAAFTPTLVTIAASATGSSGEAHAQNFAQIIIKATNGTVRTSVVPGSNALQTLLSGTGDIAIHGTGAGLYDLVNGVGQYAKLKTSDMRSLWPSVPVPIHLIALAGSKVNSISDLKGFTIAGPLPGINPQLTQFLTTAGYDLEKDFKVHWVGALGTVLNELRDGKADVAWTSTGHPAAAISELEISKPIKFIEIPPDLTKKVNDKYFGGATVFVPGTFNAGTYYKSFTKEIRTPFTPPFVIASKNTSPDLVYWLTKTFWENKSEIDSRWALAKQITKDMIPGINGSLWPIHDGALRYYKEMGLKVN